VTRVVRIDYRLLEQRRSRFKFRSRDDLFLRLPGDKERKRERERGREGERKEIARVQEFIVIFYLRGGVKYEG